MNWLRIAKHPIFISGIILKLILIFSFDSIFAKTYFIPFIDLAVQNMHTNPWTLLPPEHFPYGGFLYVWMMWPKLIGYVVFSDLALGAGPLGLFLFKLPLLIMDVLLLGLLIETSSQRWKSVLWLYWLNPVAMYILYIHGQLDIVSVSLTLASAILLTKNRPLLSALFFGFATSSKFHVVAVAPLLLTYIWNRQFLKVAIKQLCGWVSVWLFVAFFGLLPVITANVAGNATLGSPEMQRLLAVSVPLKDGLALYLGVLVVLGVIGRLVISTAISQVGLLFGVGMILSTLVVVTHSAPGWHFWALPTLVLFFANYLNVKKLPFFLYIVLYLAFFMTAELSSDWFSTLPVEVTSAIFTALQTALAANIIAMWIIVVREECRVDRRSRPLIIGLAGDSGSGKNTFTESLNSLFGKSHTTVIEGDNYHKWERGNNAWERYTHLNPKANHLFELASHVRQITSGRPFQKSQYSHDTGRFTTPVEMRPSNTLIVQGLHTLYLKNLRSEFDLKVFMSPSDLVRTAWKVKRDVLERGYAKDKVLSQLDKRENDSHSFIQTQQEHADLIIEFKPLGDFNQTQAEAGETPTCSLNVALWNDVDLHPLVQGFHQAGVEVEISLFKQDLNRISLSLKSPPKAEIVQKVANSLFESLRAVTRSYHPPIWNDGYQGFLQLLTLWVLNQRKQSQGVIL